MYPLKTSSLTSRRCRVSRGWIYTRWIWLWHAVIAHWTQHGEIRHLIIVRNIAMLLKIRHAVWVTVVCFFPPSMIFIIILMMMRMMMVGMVMVVLVVVALTISAIRELHQQKFLATLARLSVQLLNDLLTLISCLHSEV